MKLDGNFVAEELLKDKPDCTTALAIVSSGDDKASATYINTLKKLGSKLGVTVRHVVIPSDFTTEQFKEYIYDLNEDETVGSILVMYPLPKRYNREDIADAVAPEKDIDCQGAVRQGMGYRGGDMPCTPSACLLMLLHSDIELEGKKVVVVGRSNVVGKPLVELLQRYNATVTLCHTKTKDLKNELLTADVVITATGHTHLITSDMVREDAIIVDAGISFKDGKICGDVDPDVYNKVAAYTPVPGGVGVVSNAVVFFKHYAWEVMCSSC